MVKNKDFFLLVGPALSIVSIISFVSICWLFFISFYNFTFGDHLDSAKFVGFENYINLLFGYDDTFYDSLKITFVYILSSLFAELIINPENLNKYISAIEISLNKTAKINLCPMQPGDIQKTHSDTSLIYDWINFKPSTDIKNGVKNFVSWYLNYHHKSG